MTESPGRAVAVIPPHQTLDDLSAAMKGIGRCYPKNTLFLTSDVDGSTIILHRPGTAPAAAEQTKPAEPHNRRARRSGANGEISLGKDEIGDLLSYAFDPTTKQEDGVAAIAGWMASVIDGTEGAANFVTYTFDDPATSQRYAMTVQRCDGLTPAEKLRQAEERIAELEALLDAKPANKPEGEG